MSSLLASIASKFRWVAVASADISAVLGFRLASIVATELFSSEFSCNVS